MASFKIEDPFTRTVVKLNTADTILDQLSKAPPGEGVGRLKVMVNARDFVRSDNSVAFRFSGSRTYNKIFIELEKSDTYKVMIGWAPLGEFDSYEDIYNFQLASLFTELTGLDTHL